VVGQSTTEDEVDIGGLGPWTCSCSFYQGCLLPCRHLFYVASTQEGLAVYPLKALALRWNLSAAASLINSLQTAMVDMASLRIPRKRKRHAAARAVVSAYTSEEGDSAPYSELDDDWANSANDQLADVGRVVEGVGRVRVRPVASVTLRRGEAASGVVIGDIEKQNAVLAQIEPLKTYLIAQGTARFWTLAIELDSVLMNLVKSWLLDEASIPTTSANATTISTDATSVTATSTDATSSVNATSVTTTSGGEGDTSVDGSQFDDLPELPDYDLPEVTDYDNDTDEEVDDMEPRRFVFAEDIGTSFSMSEPVLSMSPAPIRHVRFPRVHSPLASPSSFQVYGDLDLNDDVRSIMQDAVTRHVLPLAPPPHIFRDFNTSLPSCSMKDAPSVRELIAEVDDGEGMDGIAQDDDPHGAMNRSFETPIDDTLVMYSPSTADPDHAGLRAIDEELAAEQALRFPLLDTPSRNTRGAKRKRALSDAGHSQGHSREKQNMDMSPMQPTGALQPSPSTSPTQPAVIAAQPFESKPRGVIKDMVLANPLSKGNRRRTGQATSIVGRRKALIPQIGVCSVYLEDFVQALDYTPIPAAEEAPGRYDIRFTEKAILNRGASATKKLVDSEDARVNFVLPRDVFNMLDAAVALARQKDGVSVSNALQRGSGEQFVAKITGVRDCREFCE
jgi:hypothetical protein